MNFLFWGKGKEYLVAFGFEFGFGFFLVLFDEVVKGNVFHELKKYINRQIAVNGNSNEVVGVWEEEGEDRKGWEKFNK